MTFPGTTWYVRTAVSFGLSLSRFWIVSAGILAKAASVGAKTVKGPLPLRVSTRPAAFTAVTRVLKEPASMAVSTIFFVIFTSFSKIRKN